jgi:hypothetical protein
MRDRNYLTFSERQREQHSKLTQIRIMNLTQSRKGAKKKRRQSFLFLFAPLRLCVRSWFYFAPFKYLSNHAKSHSIFALRFESFVSPCGSPGYTTNSVGTLRYSLSAR